MRKGGVDVGELLETEDDVVGRSVPPGTAWHKRSSDSLELLVVVDSVGGSLDVQDVASIDEGLGALRRHCVQLLALKTRRQAMAGEGGGREGFAYETSVARRAWCRP